VHFIQRFIYLVNSSKKPYSAKNCLRILTGSDTSLGTFQLVIKTFLVFKKNKKYDLEKLRLAAVGTVDRVE